MTPDHSALIERLEERSEVFCGVGKMALSRDLAEAAAALRDLTEWRDIATAPKDVRIQVWANNWHWQDREVGYFHSTYNGHKDVVTRGGRCGPAFRIGTEDGPTHWLPLPSATNQAKEAGE